MDALRSERPTGEIAAVWALFALEAAATFVTYWRLPAEELYHVGDNGPLAAAGRVLVLVNYPVAIAAIGVLAVLLERGAPRAPAWLAIGLCALVGVTVDQDDLDARAVNILPAAGVAIAVALTVSMGTRLRLAPRRDLDPVRIAVAAAIVLLSVPWLFAEVGFYAPDPFLAEERIRDGDETLAAVHVGFHHGMGGALLALAALLLSRVAHTVPVRAVVAAMFAYGLANAVQDAWHEQVWKRGTTDFDIPSVTVPSLSVGWAVIVAAAVALTLLSLLRPPGSPR